jgi:uracil-DNA glycosylase
MPQPFDPGYAEAPFAELAADFPGPGVYPPSDFRVDGGRSSIAPRLDGSVRVLVLG